VDRRFRCETAYTPAQVRAFCQAARSLGIEVIPLVQCLGHMETPLSVARYRRMREVAHSSNVLNPLARGARELVQGMVDDVLALCPDVRWFHLGGDEAWSFGTHPDTKAFVAKHGKGALYLKHVGPILDRLNARGVRPILWHDMMREWDAASLRRLAAKADLCVWGYGGHPLKDMGHHVNAAILRRFARAGIPMWGGAAYKGADGHNVDLPNLAKREANAVGWADTARQHRLVGVIATAWSRYSTHDVQCEPIDGALDSLVNVGVILHDGRPPWGGVEACVAALDRIGEGDRFRACRDALAKLAEARGRCRTAIAELREMVAMAGADRRRRTSDVLIWRWRNVRDNVAGAEAAAEAVRRALRGLMPALWIERYLQERLEPLQEQRAELGPRAQKLDPDGWAALANG
jgi:hexosaminidase